MTWYIFFISDTEPLTFLYIGVGVISILFIVFFIWRAIANARAANWVLEKNEEIEKKSEDLWSYKQDIGEKYLNKNMDAKMNSLKEIGSKMMHCKKLIILGGKNRKRSWPDQDLNSQPSY